MGVTVNTRIRYDGRSGRKILLKPAEMAVVMAELLAGEGSIAIAEKIGCSLSSVNSCLKHIPPELLADVQKRLDENRGRKILNLVYTNLEKNIRAQNAILDQVTNEEWRSQQPANELAELYATISDRGARVFEAIERANNQQKAIEAGSSAATDLEESIEAETIDNAFR